MLFDMLGRGEAPGVAIIGLACRFPGANSAERYWANLLAGLDCIARTDAPDSANGYVGAAGRLDAVDRFDAEFFRTPPVEASVTDPQQRILLEVASEALEDAGYAGVADLDVGVFAGSGTNHYLTEYVLPNAARRPELDEVRTALGNKPDFLAPRIAFKLGLSGPSLTVQASCSTGLTSVVLACQALAAGDCALALAGGVSLLMPDTDGYEYREGGVFSRDGYCRPFDQDADGTVPGAGAGIVVLKRDDLAREARDHRRVVIRGWAVNNDGGSRGGFTVPNVEGQSRVIRRALRRAGAQPGDIGYVEAHGTATAIGDVVEIEALRRVFAAEDLPPASCEIGSVKANIGHTDAASGVAGLIKAAFAVEQRTIPANPHFHTANPELRLDRTPFHVSAETISWRDDRPPLAGVSSFGIGGTNAHVILERASSTPAGPPERVRQLIVLSARSEDELGELRRRLGEWLARQQTLEAEDLADIGFTLAVGRATFPWRWATTAGTAEELTTALADARAPSLAANRLTLAVTGGPEELAAAAEPGDPLLVEVAATLTSTVPSLADDGPVPSALRHVLSLTHALRALGLSFARIDAPEWLEPALSWSVQGEDPAAAPSAVVDCEALARARTGADLPPAVCDATISPGVELAEVLEALWTAGAEPDWSRYWDNSRRGRRSLPSYPLRRERFWLERIPAQTPEMVPAQAPIAAGTPIGEVVATTWREVLELDAIGTDAHFSDDLGGDSILALEIVARLTEQFGVELPPDLLVVAPTIAQSTTRIEGLLDERSDGDGSTG